MIDPLDELKARARLLQRRIRRADPIAVRRLRALREHRTASDAELAKAVATIQLRHCLAVIAAELGFSGWPPLRAAVGGEWRADEYGELLCPPRCGGHLNHWFRSHADALKCQQRTGGYVLAYHRQYLVVDRHYLETLGLDPEAPEWQRIGPDWTHPGDVAARTRLYGELIRALPREVET